MSGLSLMSVGSMVNTKEATAEAGDVLNGKTFFAGDYHIKTGTMPNKGAWNDSVAMNGSVTIPAGYHNGSGKVSGPSITDNGAWNGSVAMNSSIAIPAGYHNGSGKVSGPNITNRGAWQATINPGGSVAIPEGYHNGSGKVVSTSVSISSSGGSNSVWTYDNSTTVTVAASFSGSPKNCYAYLSSVTGVRFYDNSIGNISIGSPWISGNTAYVNVTGNKNTSGAAQMWGANVTFIFIYY